MFTFRHLYKLWLMMIAVYEYQANAMLEANHVGMDKKIKIFDLDFE